MAYMARGADLSTARMSLRSVVPVSSGRVSTVVRLARRRMVYKTLRYMKEIYFLEPGTAPSRREILKARLTGDGHTREYRTGGPQMVH